VTTLLALVSSLGGGLCAALGAGVAATLWLRARSLRAELGAIETQALTDKAAGAAALGQAEADRDTARAELVAEQAARAEVEERLTATRAREQSILEAQEAFLSRMSHELRTPLNAVTGYAELLLEDASADLRPDLERIRVAAANLGALVTSVLDLSELQSGDFAIRPETLPLEQLLDTVVDASRFAAEQQRNQILIEVEPGLVVTLDKRMLFSILFHLVSNACKFTMKGTVRVTARSAQPNLHGVPTDGVEIVVSDTGIGMTPRQVEAAFQPFAQGDLSFTRRYDGGGVGLAVVNGFVRAMGGEVAIHSAPGSGATVKVLLPKEVRPRDDTLGDDEDTMLLR
jgi:signal transduction histidine kinase